MAKDEKPEDLLSDTEDEELVEIPVGLTLDKKLDQIIDLLKKNEKEHREIRDELQEIKTDISLLRAGYKQHGRQLGELTVAVNGHFNTKL
jgi:transcriptional regulator of heat shock response